MLLMLVAGHALGQPTTAPSPPDASKSKPPPAKPIFLPPPLLWDNRMISYQPALQQSATNFTNLTEGIAFGMSPAALNAKLPEPFPGLSWSRLSLANEYPGEARYLGVPIAAAGALAASAGCAGAGSYVVFLFNPNGLFRISFRLLPDQACPDTSKAAQEIYARYVPLSLNVAFSVRYRTGRADVVDITDPTLGYLLPVRWHQGGS